MAAAPPYPLYNRMYTLYRVSPLHHGDIPLLDTKGLQTHAKRLKEQLKGDNVRGVDVDFAGSEGALSDKGPLEECQWNLIGDEMAWIDLHNQPDEPLNPEQARGIEINLEYEKQSYNALLLRDPETTTSPENFTSLPLLLVKMPAPIRDIFLNYLRTAFDAHVASLNLSPALLMSSLETYFRHLSASSSSQSVLDVVQKLQLQLTFPNNNNTLLKSIDISIAGRDVSGFLSRGKLLPNLQGKPFTSAISKYLETHLALDISNPKVQISRVVCHSFQLSTDRIRLGPPDISGDLSFSEDGDAPEGTASQQAMDDFYASLIREATGSGKFLPESFVAESKSFTPTSSKSVKAGRRKRAVSNTATQSATPKRSKPRGKENGRRRNRDEDMASA